MEMCTPMYWYRLSASRQRLVDCSRSVSLQLDNDHERPIVGFWPFEASNSNRSSSLLAKQQRATRSDREVTEFKWDAWWHTGCLPSGILASCAPQDRAAALAVFPFSGMVGASEACADSIGGALKRCSQLLSIARCEEDIIWRSTGLGGASGGGEDVFLETFF